MLGWVDNIGERTIVKFRSTHDVLLFTVECFVHFIRPSSYNPAMRTVIIKQIYFTAVEIIPLFLMMAVIFGSVIIGAVIAVAAAYDLQEHIGSIVVTFVVDEFAPFFTTLLIALRSGAAINTEIAVMRVNKELNTLRAYRIDIIDYLFLPRIIGGVLSITLLSIVFAIIMLSSGYIFTFFYMDMALVTYKKLLIDAISMTDMGILFGKSLLFGFVTITIPLYSGLTTRESYSAIPISVLTGMVRLFVLLFFIEVVSLVLQLL